MQRVREASGLWIAGILLASASSTLAQPLDGARAAQRRVVEPGGFVDRPGPANARAKGCQPVRGDVVTVRQSGQLAPGLQDVFILEVVVTSGQCKGAVGWIGSHYVTSAELSR